MLGFNSRHDGRESRLLRNGKTIVTPVTVVFFC